MRRLVAVILAPLAALAVVLGGPVTGSNPTSQAAAAGECVYNTPISTIGIMVNFRSASGRTTVIGILPGGTVCAGTGRIDYIMTGRYTCTAVGDGNNYWDYYHGASFIWVVPGEQTYTDTRRVIIGRCDFP